MGETTEGSGGAGAREPWATTLAGLTAEIQAGGRWRRRRVFVAEERAALREEGAASPLVSFASNDYLALSREPRVVAAAVQALERNGAGSGAAPARHRHAAPARRPRGGARAPPRL